jgi:hypothetical protein
MAGEAAPGGEDTPELRTLADKLNCLIEHATRATGDRTPLARCAS